MEGTFFFIKKNWFITWGNLPFYPFGCSQLFMKNGEEGHLISHQTIICLVLGINIIIVVGTNIDMCPVNQYGVMQ